MDVSLLQHATIRKRKKNEENKIREHVHDEKEKTPAYLRVAPPKKPQAIANLQQHFGTPLVFDKAEKCAQQKLRPAETIAMSQVDSGPCPKS